MKTTIKAIITLIIISTVSCFIFAACNNQQGNTKNGNGDGNGAFPVEITDVYGSKVTVDKMPEKIVVLAPSTVEILYKLGLGDKIAGVTEYCNYPEGAKSKPKVGDFNGVNLEKIIELKPDIVFAGSGMTKETYEKLVSLKIKVIVTEAKTLAQIPETFIMIGKATGTEINSKALADELNASINSFREKVKNANKVKTYYVISFGKEGNWTGGKGTFMSDIISIAGGENIANDIEGWMEYSAEKLIEKNPDVILLSAMVANNNNQILDAERGYKETSAVKNDKVIIIDDNLTQRPGPRIVQGIELVAKALHPEIFNK